MSVRTEAIEDPAILTCCLEHDQEPYIGVDAKCNKSAIFCLEHSSHINSEGLIHQMLSLRQFKRTVFSKKFIMQEKVEALVNTFSSFMDRLMEEIRELKLRKCLQLSMLWLRELANDENEYQLMKQVYRMDFRNLTCQDIHSVYFKIIHNDELYSRSLKEIKCYEGISQVLSDIAQNQKAIRLISEKITEIEGVLTSGRILRKVLPDQRVLKPNVKEILLEQSRGANNYHVNYFKATLGTSSHKYLSIFSKYPMIPHTTYHIAIKSKYSNIILGVCMQAVKDLEGQVDLHYHQNSVTYNCSNGNTYKDGIFMAGSNSAIKGLKEIVLKLRVTGEQIIVMTRNDVLMRSSISKLNGDLYLHALARTKGDYFEFERDKEVSADNLSLLKAIERHKELEEPVVSEMSDQEEQIYQSQSRVRQDDCSEMSVSSSVKNMKVSGTSEMKISEKSERKEVRFGTKNSNSNFERVDVEFNDDKDSEEVFARPQSKGSDKNSEVIGYYNPDKQSQINFLSNFDSEEKSSIKKESGVFSKEQEKPLYARKFSSSNESRSKVRVIEEENEPEQSMFKIENSGSSQSASHFEPVFVNADSSSREGSSFTALKERYLKKYGDGSGRNEKPVINPIKVQESSESDRSDSMLQVRETLMNKNKVDESPTHRPMVFDGFLGDSFQGKQQSYTERKQEQMLHVPSAVKINVSQDMSDTDFFNIGNSMRISPDPLTLQKYKNPDSEALDLKTPPAFKMERVRESNSSYGI